MAKENINQEFRSKNIDETRNLLIEEINQNEMMSKKHKKVWTTLNYKALSYFRFCNSWMYFNFCFCFFGWYSYRNYEFCNRIKNLGNSCIN